MSGINDMSENVDEMMNNSLKSVDKHKRQRTRKIDSCTNETSAKNSGSVSPTDCSENAVQNDKSDTDVKNKSDELLTFVSNMEKTECLETVSCESSTLMSVPQSASFSDCPSTCERINGDETSGACQSVAFASSSTSPTVSHSDDMVIPLETEDSLAEPVKLVSVKHFSDFGDEDRSSLCNFDMSEPLTGSEAQDQPTSSSDSSEASISYFFDSDECSEPYGSYTVNPEENTGEGQGPEVTQANDESVTHAERQRITRKRLYRFTSTSSSEEDEFEMSTSSCSSSSSGKSSSNSGSYSTPKACKLDESLTKVTKDVWKQTCDIFNRQLGYGTADTPGFNFQRRVYGSLNLAQRLQLYTKYERHKGCVNALNFNETGTLIASGSDDLQIVIWDWARKKSYIEFDSGHRANVFQSKFMPYTGDCHVVSCARDGQVRLAQLSVTGTCRGTKKLAQHKGAAHKLAILPDSCHVFLSCGEDGVTYQIDLRQEKPVKLYTTKEKNKLVALYSIHANPYNTFEHCVAGRDQYIRIYDTRKVEGDSEAGVVKKFCPHLLLESKPKTHVTCAVYNYNGTAILGSYNDEDIYLFDNSHSDGAEYIHKYSGHRNSATVKGVNFYGPKSEFVVSGSDCGNVFLWDVESEAIVNYFHADENGVINVLEPHPHMPMLATSGLDNDVKLWMPVAEKPAEMQGLSKVIKKNKKDREKEQNEPQVIGSEMLWYLMQRLRRSAVQLQEEGDTSSDSSNDVSSEDEDDESHPVQCTQS